MRADKILDRLYVGGCPIEPSDVQTLKDLGVTAVLNLQTEEDIQWRGVNREDIEATYRQFRIKEVREPIRDFDYEQLRLKLPDAVRALLKLLDQGHTVYVHCTAGMNRSPTVVIAYLYWVLHWDLDEATQYVCLKHFCDPCIETITEQAAPKWDEEDPSPSGS